MRELQSLQSASGTPLPSRAKLELFEARDVMASPVKTIRSIESLGGLARMLLSHSHGGIPVVRYDPHTRHEIAYGLITR